jgi:hypothetical protein
MPDFAITGLDVVIGLAFVFFIVSLLAAAINESIATMLNWRAAQLEDAIKKLLGDPSDAVKFFNHPAIAALSPRKKVKTKPVARTYRLGPS